MTDDRATPQLPALASLLRRLAETADGFPADATVYAVAEPRFPHRVLAADTSVSPRLSKALAASATAQLYGPLRAGRGEVASKVEPEPAALRLGGVWVHDPDSTWRWEEEGAVTAVGREVGEVLRRTGIVGPGEPLPDAIIFTDQAARKFVAPYLVQVYGVEEAMRMLRRE
jgi:hypothetical protein